VVYYNKYTRIAVMKVKRGLHNLLLQTLSLISQIKTVRDQSIDVFFKTIHVAGMIETGIIYSN